MNWRRIYATDLSGQVCITSTVGYLYNRLCARTKISLKLVTTKNVRRIIKTSKSVNLLSWVTRSRVTWCPSLPINSPHLFRTEKQQILNTRISGALDVSITFWSLHDSFLKASISLAHLWIISNCNGYLHQLKNLVVKCNDSWTQSEKNSKAA